MSSRRVVITGIGCVTSLGLNASESWKNILASQSGIRNINQFDTSKLTCKIASFSEEFNAEDSIEPRDVIKMDRFIHLGIAAAKEAIEDSGWLPEDEESKNRTGVMVGSVIGGLSTIEETSLQYHEN